MFFNLVNSCIDMSFWIARIAKSKVSKPSWIFFAIPRSMLWFYSLSLVCFQFEIIYLTKYLTQLAFTLLTSILMSYYSFLFSISPNTGTEAPSLANPKYLMFVIIIINSAHLIHRCNIIIKSDPFHRFCDSIQKCCIVRYLVKIYLLFCIVFLIFCIPYPKGFSSLM